MGLSLQAGAERRTRQSTRVSRDADGFVSSLTGSQWIATGISQCPRDDKVGGKDVGGSVTSRSLSLRGGNVSDRRGNPLCLEGRGRLSLRLLVPSGSPRAFLNALAMTRWGKDSESPISTEIVPIWIIFFD